MTSRLPRKPRTTAWSSPRKKDVKALAASVGGSGRFLASLAVIALLGLATSKWSPLAGADESPQHGPAIKTVSYSSDQAGPKLKWLPYRPSKRMVDSQVVPTSGTSGDLRSVVRLDQVAEKDEPQASKKSEPPPLRLSEPLNDKLLQKPALGPKPWDLMPQQRTDEPVPRGRTSQSEQPLLPTDLAAKPAPETCPTLEDLNLKPIRQITNDITPKGDKFPFECSLKQEQYQPRSWPVITYTWKAAGTCHKPLYFEEAHLERYGHALPPYIQPFASAAHFFLVVPALPYFMGVYPPNECMYTLGYYRPGSCAPYLLDPFPISVRGALFEAAAWTGAVFVIP